MAKAPMLIALPSGLTMGGVQVWAARLCNALVARGRGAGLILHPPVGTPLDVPLDPRVRVTHVHRALGEADGNLTPYLSTYGRAVDELWQAAREPVVCVPCHLGDCAGLFAALTQRDSSRMRVAGWCHLDIPYDLRVLEWYSPVLDHVAAVSDHLAGQVPARLARAKVWSIANGVEPGPARVLSGFRGPRAGSPLRIVYVGRLNRDVKRVMALFAMSDALNEAGVRHRLTIVGDGPARGEVERAAAVRDCVRTIANAPPAEVTRLFDEHDVFVLPSRVEGLSIAMLEAMARGCVPIVARTESGCGQAIDGENGLIVDVGAGADEAVVGRELAKALAGCVGRLGEMSQRATRTVEERFSHARHTDLVEALLDEAAAGPRRVWPKDRPAAFTAKDPRLGSGAVPKDGAALLRELLRSLAGRRVLIHGTGRHSVELAGVLEEFRDRVVAFTDDDPARHGGEFLRLPIVPPGAAGRTGATDVVISSWMNQEQIWAGRGAYERQRVRVHRIYLRAA